MAVYVEGAGEEVFWARLERVRIVSPFCCARWEPAVASVEGKKL